MRARSSFSLTYSCVLVTFQETREELAVALPCLCQLYFSPLTGGGLARLSLEWPS